MNTFKLEAHVGQDGILKLELPVEITGSDIEVLVVIQRKEKRRWPEGYFDRTAGSLSDNPIERPSQGEYEEREPLL